MTEATQWDALVLRWRELKEQGQDVSAEELCADSPELLEDLRREIHALVSMEAFLGAAGASGTTGGGLRTGPGPGDAPSGARSPLQPPPGYEVLGELGRGGMGVVYRARRVALKRLVALKMVLPGRHTGAAQLARFRAEAEAGARLDHPGIVPVYEVGEHEGLPYFSMALVEGETLAQRLARGPLPPREAAELVRPVAQAMAYAHERGVVHRDLKPSNILVGTDGRPRVTDFGIAKRVEEDSGLTATGQILGTPCYMAPEQATGTKDIGPAADVYALGVVLYELLVGRPPFQAASAIDTLNQVLHEEPVPPRRLNPSVPRDLETVCLKCLQKPPPRRCASAAELAEELGRFLAGEPIRARPVGVLERGWRWCRRNPLVGGLTAAAVAALVGLVVGSLLLLQEQGLTLKAEQAKVKAEQAKVKAEQAKGKEQEGRALAQVNALLSANPQAVPSILEGLEPFRAQLHARLREERDRPAPPEATAAARRRWRQHRTRAALALLADDPEQLAFLKQRLLAEDVEPEEMLLIRDFLPVTPELAKELWAEVDRRRDLKDPGRFRALVALARFNPDSPRWETQGHELIGPLLAAEPLYVGVWSRGLSGVRASLMAPLGKAFRDHARSSEARLAAGVLCNWAAERPDVLADLLADADAQQFPLMLAALRPHGERAVTLLQDLASGDGKTPDAVASMTEQARDRLGQRRANAAVALLHLERPGRVWALLRQSPYPDARTYFLHRAGPLGADMALLLRRLDDEADASARQALILSLGEYAADQVPADLAARWTARLLEWYRDDPDPGVHAAIDWLLRHGKDGPLPRKRDWGQVKELRKIDEEFKGRPPEGRRRWYVNGQGQTLVLLGPAEFVMGSPLDEANRFSTEVPHRRRIGRRFALASKKVTVAQFKRFLKDHPEVKHTYTERFSPEADGPIISVTWYEAAQYCNWLSAQEGIPEAQWCYPSIAEIEKRKTDGKPLKLPADYLARTGYRLPTEAEWEFACRAGAASSRFYGSSLEMLGQYAWYQHNVQDRTWPVGQKKPNAFGLFDMHGNTWDWCQEGYAPYKVGAPGEAVADEEDKRDVTDQLSRVLRGGSFYSQPTGVRCAFRLSYRPSGRVVFIGFGLRVARTCD